MDNNWTLVYTSSKLYEAELFKELLDDNEITGFVMNKQDSSYHIGNVEVYVKPEDELKARSLIEKFEN